VSAVYHLANGMATGAQVLGLAVTLKQKERCLGFCTGAAFVLMAIGMAAWYAFAPAASH